MRRFPLILPSPARIEFSGGTGALPRVSALQVGAEMCSCSGLIIRACPQGKLAYTAMRSRSDWKTQPASQAIARELQRAFPLKLVSGDAFDQCATESCLFAILDARSSAFHPGDKKQVRIIHFPIN